MGFNGNRNQGHITPGHRRRGPALKALMALCVAIAVILGGCGEDTNTSDDDPAWSEAEPMPEARGEVSAAIGERQSGCDAPPCTVIAVIGGYTFPAVTEARVDGYLPDQDRWIELPELPEARHHLAASEFEDGAIVATGGAPSAVDETPRQEAWILTPDADRWESFDALPEGRWGHRLVWVDERLVVVGGHGGDETMIWSQEEGWEIGEPIPEARDHLGAVVIDDEVWTIGGRDEDFTTRIDIYDPREDSWRDGPALPEPTSASAVGVVDDHLVVVSGEEYGAVKGGIVENAWMLDLADSEERWKPLAPPPVHVHGAGDAVFGTGDDQRLYVFGGASWHAQWSTMSWTDRVQVLHEPRPAEE